MCLAPFQTRARRGLYQRGCGPALAARVPGAGDTGGGGTPQACRECSLLRLLTLVQAQGVLQTQGDRKEPPNKIDDYLKLASQHF